MKPRWKISGAGFAATAISYGPGRIGFGLFLPEFRSVFSISTGTAGLIAGLGFLGFLLGLIAAYALVSRHGPRLPVILGLAAATLGMGLVTLAPNLTVLTLGIFLSMSSAGFAWAPFNNAVNRQVRDQLRPEALSIVSTGTSLGIVAAGSMALLLSLGDHSWRIGWAAFAIASALAILANWVALREVAGRPGSGSTQRWGALIHAPAIPLYGIALSFGTTTAIYVSFAADWVEQSGGIPFLPANASPALIFVCYGLFGFLGLATGRAKAAIGLSRLLRLLLTVSALSLLLIAVAPTSYPGVILSAGLQGIYVMMMSAVLAFWSERLFPALPALSFTAALLAVAAGSVLGPVAAGFLADAMGAQIMFLIAAGMSVATAATVVRHNVRERSTMA